MPAQVSSKHSHAQPLKGGVVPCLMLDGARAPSTSTSKRLAPEEIGERVMDLGRIMNASIEINGASVMLMDPMPEHGHPPGPA